MLCPNHRPVRVPKRFACSGRLASFVAASEPMADKVLTVVKRRPGGNAHVMQRFLKLEAHTDISVLDAFEAVVVPALEQRNVLRGRVWGRLVQAEVLLKHDADQGLIQVDQVCLHTGPRYRLLSAPLDLPAPSRGFPRPHSHTHPRRALASCEAQFSDNIKDYLEMGLARVEFTVSQAGVEPRQWLLSQPAWSSYRIPCCRRGATLGGRR